MTERHLRRIVRTHAPFDHSRTARGPLFAWWDVHHLGNKTGDDLVNEIFDQLKMGDRMGASVDYVSLITAFDDLIQAARQL